MMDSQSTEQPPRASFLGLPTELRIRVYEYLFSHGRRQIDKHCCLLDTSARGLPRHQDQSRDLWEQDPFICGCSVFFESNLLRVSKLISEEARTVLSESIEYRHNLSAQTQYEVDTNNDTHSNACNTLGSSSPDRKLLLTAFVRAELIEEHGGPAQPAMAPSIKHAWPSIRAAHANAKHVRLHLDLDARTDLRWFPAPDFRLTFDCTEFAGLAEMGRLETIEIQLCDCHPVITTIKNRPWEQTAPKIQRALIDTLDQTLAEFRKKTKIVKITQSANHGTLRGTTLSCLLSVVAISDEEQASAQIEVAVESQEPAEPTLEDSLETASLPRLYTCRLVVEDLDTRLYRRTALYNRTGMQWGLFYHRFDAEAFRAEYARVFL